jgi:hypothetical protein
MTENIPYLGMRSIKNCTKVGMVKTRSSLYVSDTVMRVIDMHSSYNTDLCSRGS